MSSFIDLTGKRFGRWTVIERANDYIDRKGHKFPAWKCKCDCGAERVVLGGNLAKGKSKSCGCLKDELNRERCQAEKSNIRYRSLEEKPSIETMIKVMLGDEYETTPEEQRKDKAIQAVFYNCWFKFVRDEQAVIRRYKRKHPTCEMCGKVCDTELHHKRPVAMYGGNEPENIAWLCKECHSMVERGRAKR